MSAIDRVGGNPHVRNHRARHVDLYLPLLRLAFGDQASWGGLRVLVLFAGQGREAEFFVPYARELTLVDDYPSCAKFLRGRFDGMDHVRVFENNGRDLAGVETGSIDCCTALVALMHICSRATRDGYAEEIRRVVRPGGRVLAQVIEGDGWLEGTDDPYGARNVGFLCEQDVVDYWERWFAVDYVVRSRPIPEGGEAGRHWWWVIATRRPEQ